ncbi:putative nuclease HARBI1 [Macrobrachium nipponense]|uniref:putative nuclease HARBI1 n=1 Tax=Macrobrachium nipponense TaxID=159736 RepID=UPI0030C7F296
MSKRKACIAILLALASEEVDDKNKKRRLWMKEWYKKRCELSHQCLLNELLVSSPEDYRNYLRMDHDTFMNLLTMVSPIIKKKTTQLRDAIPASQRLLCTLRLFLATGDSFEDLKFACCISPQCLGNIVIETCDAIVSSLKDVIKIPESEEEWMSVSEEFDRKWDFPHCLGAIDGKHVKITKPYNSGSYYYNYKGTFSVVLMAIVNAKCQFLMVHIGTNGRVSDRGVYGNTRFSQDLTEDKLHIPAPSPLPGTTDPVPYVLIGDDAFPLLENIMKPYSHANLTKEQQIYNYRVSRARNVVERTFGMLSSRFRILHSTINLSPTKVSKIILACCYLHNYMSGDGEQYVESISRRQLIPFEPTVQQSSLSAKDVRNKYCQYFNGPGWMP